MSGAWCFVAGWCSAAGLIALASWGGHRAPRRREFQSTTQFAAEHGWPETQH